MHLVDSHSHLFSEEFNHDLLDVIKRAKEVGVEKVFLPNIDSSTIEALKKTVLIDRDFFFPLMGLHPTSVKANYKQELDIIMKELSENDYKAVGEIGIDLYWDKTFLNEQIDAFEQQCEIAKTKSLPIIIHCRDSFDEIFSVVDRKNDDNLNGIFHCFTGNLEQAKRILDYGGFKLGIGGVVTFKNGGLDKFLSQIPLKHLVLETDSPYLSPVPFRGKRNETSYIKFVAEKVAEIYGITVEEVAEETTRNCKEVFGI